MEQLTGAPWAEPVTTVPYPMSLEEFLVWPGEGWDDNKLCELVKGQVVRNPYGGWCSGSIHAKLAYALYRYGEAHSQFGGVGCHCILDLRDEKQGTCIKPGLLLVQNERLPPEEWDRPLELAPDLVVEIAREGQDRPALGEKARLWLIAGVRLVWIIWPREQAVDVWVPSQPEPIQTLKIGDQLDGQEVAPGFSYPLADLFKH